MQLVTLLYLENLDYNQANDTHDVWRLDEHQWNVIWHDEQADLIRKK